MKLIKKIAHILLVGLLLVSTMGVTMNKHYCMGRLKSVSYYHEAHSCMEMAGMDDMDSCSKSCCQDTHEEFKIDDLAQVAFSLDLQGQFYLISSFEQPLLESLLSSAENPQVNFRHYKPPLTDRDIPIMIQSFLL